MYIKNWGVGESDGVSGERDEMGGGFCARRADRCAQHAQSAWAQPKTPSISLRAAQ